MTLQQLRYFLAVAGRGSFSQAAAALYISQPALSKQISLLEKSLQFTLFDRTARGVTLTEKGQILHARLQPLLQELDVVVQELAEPTELRLGALPSLAAHYLPSLMARMDGYTIAPVAKDTTEELLQMVQAGELDGALVQDQEAFGKLKALFLFEEPYLVAVPMNHPLAERECLQPSDLHGEKIVLHQSPCDIRNALLEGFAALSIEPVIALEASFNDSLLGYTASGAGLSFLPQMVAANVTHKNIVYKRISGEPFRRSIYLYARNIRLFQESEGLMTCST